MTNRRNWIAVFVIAPPLLVSGCSLPFHGGDDDTQKLNTPETMRHISQTLEALPEPGARLAYLTKWACASDMSMYGTSPSKDDPLMRRRNTLTGMYEKIYGDYLKKYKDIQAPPSTMAPPHLYQSEQLFCGMDVPKG